MSIIDNFSVIQKNIAESAKLSCRNPNEIQIIAVSKNFSSETIQEAVNLGIKIFGENRVQETKKKFPLITGAYSLHMIGHLQSNKAKDAVKLFEVIHSIDKIETAEKVNREAAKINKKQKILIQINSSGEKTKSGIFPENTLNIIEAVADMQNMEILGLMTMAPFTDDEDTIRRSFRLTRELLNSVNLKLGLNLKELSMGMSSDYRIAIEEGATMVRIGTAIFGKRNYQ